MSAAWSTPPGAPRTSNTTSQQEGEQEGSNNRPLTTNQHQHTKQSQQERGGSSSEAGHLRLRRAASQPLLIVRGWLCALFVGRAAPSCLVLPPGPRLQPVGASEAAARQGGVVLGRCGGRSTSKESGDEATVRGASGCLVVGGWGWYTPGSTR